MSGKKTNLKENPSMVDFQQPISSSALTKIDMGLVLTHGRTWNMKKIRGLISD